MSENTQLLEKPPLDLGSSFFDSINRIELILNVLVWVIAGSCDIYFRSAFKCGIN
jgi:hypothetical protein